MYFLFFLATVYLYRLFIKKISNIYAKIIGIQQNQEKHVQQLENI